MNIQRKNSAHHFRMQSEREQTLVVEPAFNHMISILVTLLCIYFFTRKM